MSISLFPHIFPVTCHTDHVGPGSTFVAIQGMKQNGIAYITQALKKGATTIVIEQGNDIPLEIANQLKERGTIVIFVPNARKALAELSAQALGYPAQSLKIIGVTGTKGKSTTVFLTEHILKTAGYKTALLSTVKNRIVDHEVPHNLTTPQPDYLHVFFDICRSYEVEYVVMEVAAQAMTLHRVDGIEFDVALFTNFSLEHSEFYAHLDDYFNAKAQLFKQVKPTGHALFNADDNRVYALGSGIEGAYTFGLEKGIIRALSQKGDSFSLAATVSSPKEEYTLEAPTLLGNFNLYNCLAAASIAYTQNIETKIIQRALKTFKGTPGRLERYVLPNGAIGCIDYAHNPSSFDAVLSTLRALTDHLVVIFGAGGERDPLKRPLMGASASRFADAVILTSDNPRSEDPACIVEDIRRGVEAQDKIYIELDRELAIRKAYDLTRKGSIIALLGKGPDEYQLIQGKKYPFSEAAILRSL
jgi:UDP-N-acetylmuramoyl-L-alanyl-D-glutamate--2,6-diaminopimelate ligase